MAPVLTESGDIWSRPEPGTCRRDLGVKRRNVEPLIPGTS